MSDKIVKSYEHVNFELMIESIKNKCPDGKIPQINIWNKECLDVLVDIGFLTEVHYWDNTKSDVINDDSRIDLQETDFTQFEGVNKSSLLVGDFKRFHFELFLELVL